MSFCKNDNFSGTYFNFIMGMVASSVLLTVLVLNYHHRHPETHDMPTWVRKQYILKKCPYKLHNKPVQNKTDVNIVKETFMTYWLHIITYNKMNSSKVFFLIFYFFYPKKIISDQESVSTMAALASKIS